MRKFSPTYSIIISVIKRALEHKHIILLLLVFIVIRLIAASSLGIGTDEAHYILYAKFLDWSYFDHPPLVGWIQAPIYYIFGTGRILARIVPISLFAITSLLVYILLIKISKSKKIAFISTFSLNISFLFNALSLMLVPDSILFSLLVGLILLLIRVEKDSSKITNWIGVGILLGLCGLTKYTSILFIPAILFYFVYKKRFDLIFNMKILWVICISLILISPVIYWNIINDFASLTYQKQHVLGSSSPINMKYFGESLLVEFAAYSPFLFIIAYYGVIKSIKDKNSYIKLAIFIAVTILVFFYYSSLYEKVLPHWYSCAYLLLIPIGTFYLLRNKKRWGRVFLNTSLITTSLITALLYIEVVFKFIPFGNFQSPFRDIYGFKDIIIKAEQIINSSKDKNSAMAVTNWTLASRLFFYAKDDTKTYLISKKKTQFDYWEKIRPIGKDILFINTYFFNKNIKEYATCSEYIKAGDINISLNNHLVNQAQFIWCKNFQGIKQ